VLQEFCFNLLKFEKLEKEDCDSVKYNFCRIHRKI